MAPNGTKMALKGLSNPTVAKNAAVNHKSNG